MSIRCQLVVVWMCGNGAPAACCRCVRGARGLSSTHALKIRGVLFATLDDGEDYCRRNALGYTWLPQELKVLEDASPSPQFHCWRGVSDFSDPPLTCAYVRFKLGRGGAKRTSTMSQSVASFIPSTVVQVILLAL